MTGSKTARFLVFFGCLVIMGLLIWLFQDTPAVRLAGEARMPSLPTRTFTPDPPTPSPDPSLAPRATPTRRLTPTPTPNFTPTPVGIEGEPVSIGVSVEGRPLEVVRFGSGPSRRMIVAGIHGGYEANTIVLADQLIAHLKENPGMVPPEVTLYILRSFNPDGAARGETGRPNANNVDLNRNWGVNWKEDWNRSGCYGDAAITGGEYAHSEPETQALAGFLVVQQVQVLISYHSAGLGIFAGGGEQDTPSTRLAEVLEAASGYRFPPVDTGCEYTGQLVDWAAVLGIAAVDVELTNHYDTDFNANLKLLQAFLTWQP